MKLNQSQIDHYRQFGYRFAIAAIYSLLSFVVGLCGVVVSPVTMSVVQAYQQPETVVSVIPICSMLFFVFFNLPASWVLDVKGIRKGLIVGAVLTSIGASFRCLVDTHFSFVVTGQIICAMAQPFVLNAAVKISVRWFSPDGRSIALAVLSLSSVLGMVVGQFVLPSIFLQPDASENRVQSEFKALLFFEFFITLIPLTCLKLWFRDKPPVPVGSADEITRITHKEALQCLFGNKHFWTLLLAFGTVFGAFIGYISLFRSIFSSYGYSKKEINLMPFFSIVAGIVSANLVGVYIKKTLNYQNAFRGLSSIGLLTCLGFPLFLSIMKDSVIVSSILCGLFSLVAVSLVPLTFDYACDVFFPVGEAQICGCLLAGGNTIGVILILICQLGLDLDDSCSTQDQSQISSLESIIMTSFISVIGFILYFFSGGELKRSRKERHDQNVSLITSIANQ